MAPTGSVRIFYVHLVCAARHITSLSTGLRYAQPVNSSVRQLTHLRRIWMESNTIKINVLASILLVYSTSSLAGGLLGDIANTINKSVIDAGKSIEQAHQEVGKVVENSPSLAASEDILRAQQAIKEAEKKQKEVEERFNELAVLSAQIDEEKHKLEKEKWALESREKLLRPH